MARDTNQTPAPPWPPPAPAPGTPDPVKAAGEQALAAYLDTTFAALDAHEARRQAAALELAAARAEYAVLDHYDDVRQALGHDYGNGQRHAELIRRGRELERLEAAAGDAAPALNAPGAYDAARQAAERLLTPRLRRLDREDYRAATPATRRTRTALEATLDRYRNPLYHGPRA